MKHMHEKANNPLLICTHHSANIPMLTVSLKSGNH